MKHIIIIFTIIFSCNTLKAELQGQAKIDSLLKELPKMKEDTNGVNLLLRLAYSKSIVKVEDGLDYCKKGLELSIKINWQLGILKSYTYLSGYFSMKSDLVNGMKFSLKSLKLQKKLMIVIEYQIIWLFYQC